MSRRLDTTAELPAEGHVICAVTGKKGDAVLENIVKDEPLTAFATPPLENLIDGVIEQMVRDLALQATNADGGQPPAPPLSQAEPDDRGRITVARIVRLRLTAIRLRFKAKNISARAVEKQAFYLNSFADRFGNLTLANCKNGDLTRWLLGHPEWKSSHTKADAIGSVIGCFRWAEAQRHIDRSPYKRPRGLCPMPQPRQAIEPAEFRAMLSMARQCNGKRRRRRRPSCSAFRLALWFLWETGCRSNEMREAQWDQIDWDAGVIRLTKHRPGVERNIPLSDRAIRLLAFIRKYSKRAKKAKLVFQNGRGRQWTLNAFARMFRKYADIAGVRKEVSAYCLRTSQASYPRRYRGK